jgi:REP element-mobilizing transposase RayT
MRIPILSPEIRERLWPYLGGIAKQNGIKPACIGGVADHIHLLLSLPTTIAIAKAIQLIKGASSAWVHDTFRELPNFAGKKVMAPSASAFPICPRPSNTSRTKPNIIGHGLSKRNTSHF